MEYKIIVDELVKTTRRSVYKVEAVSQDEAVQKALKESGELEYSEILYDELETIVPVEENNCQPTIQVYLDNTDHKVYDNGKESCNQVG